MPNLCLPQDLTPEDYATIESAVMETVRGRWFLMEFARRARATELSQIRDAISRLERAITNTPIPAPASALAPPAVVAVSIRAAEQPTPASPLQQALKALSRFDNLPMKEKAAMFG